MLLSALDFIHYASVSDPYDNLVKRLFFKTRVLLAVVAKYVWNNIYCHAGITISLYSIYVAAAFPFSSDGIISCTSPPF